MKKNYDIIINSEQYPGKRSYSIASGYISETTIFFEKENIFAVVQAKGMVDFYNTEDVLIASGSVPKVVSGKEVYEQINCQVQNNQICLEFPIYTWIDNYPHCDGEHDRWDTRIIGYHPLTLDLTTGSIL